MPIPGSLGRLACALAAAAGLLGPAGALELRSADGQPADYPTVQAVREMGALLKQSSQGRHTVRVFAKGVLGSEKDTIEQVKIGALAMVRVNVAPMNNICSATLVPTLPFLFRSKAHMRQVLDGPIGDEILKDCEAQGFIGLAFYDSGARSVYTVRKPLRTLAEAKGLKVRVQQSDLWVSLIEAMGANATPMPYGEVYTALKTGLIDAAENNLPSYQTARHYEVAKFYNRTEHSMAPEMLLFSRKVWDTLTPADQQLVRAAAKASVQTMRRLWDEREAQALAAVTASGVQVVEVDKTGFQAAMKPVYDKYIQAPKLQDLVRRIGDVK